jgi:ADP-ribose pyrophosphatase YjhB (NUDIX family)
LEIVTQAGAVAIRGTYPHLEVLIVRAKKNPADWIFPKGHVEKHEDSRDAALRELEEEGAVTGEVVAELGVDFFILDNRSVEVSYYLVTATKDIPPQEARERRWVTLAEARELLTYDKPRMMLDAVESRLKKNG